MKWLWKFLTSRNTGIVLLIAVSFILLFGAALPNPGLMYPADVEKLKNESPFLYWFGENFNSMKVGRSYVFGFLGILLIVSTSFCSIDRLMKQRKGQKGSIGDIPPEGNGITLQSDENRSVLEEKIVSLLRHNRWKITTANSGDARVIAAFKGDLGFWGSIFFHAVLITFIAGIVMYYFSGFYATMVFTEGQELRLEEHNLSRIDKKPLFGMTLPDLRFRFNRFSAIYYDAYNATDYTADFDVTDTKTGRTWNQILKVNQPFRYRGIDFLIIQQGYSPLFFLSKNGVPIFDAFVALHYDQENKDSFTILGENMRITAQFFPDMVRKDDGGVYSKGERPNNPYFGLDVAKNGERIFRGLVGKEQDVTFGEYRLVFQDLRTWITLNLVRETGIGFFFVCSMIGLFGVFIRVIDPEQKIFAVFRDREGGQSVTFHYSAKHFEGILREKVGEMIQSLKKEHAGG